MTDANLVLGRFPARLLGGEVELDRELALAAVRRFGDELGLDEVEAAHTIVELAVHNMEMAIREVSTRKGRDPRECVLVAFGGAGPAHAGRLAELLHVERILYPHSPGVGSTLGLLSTDVRRDYVQSLVVPLTDPEAPSALTAALVAMRSRGWESLDEEGVPDERRALRTAVDLRYARQQYTITVPLAWEEDDGGALDDAAAAFHAEHGRLCGFHYAADATMGVEVVNVRLTAIGRLERPQPASLASGASSAPPVAERRGVYFEAAADFVETPIFLRSDLRAGNVLKGPAIVEGFESTVVLPPGQVGEIDKHGNLIVTVAPSQR